MSQRSNVLGVRGGTHVGHGGAVRGPRAPGRRPARGAGTWGRSRPRWVIALLLGLAVASGPGCRPQRPEPTPALEPLADFTFAVAAAGERVSTAVGFANAGASAVEVDEVRVPPPFASASTLPVSVAPGGVAWFGVELQSDEVGEPAGTVELYSAGRLVGTREIAGRVVPDADSPPSEWLDVSIRQERTIRSGEDIVIDATIDVLPRGPVSYRHGAKTVRIAPTTVPEGVALTVAGEDGVFGERVLRHFRIVYPEDACTGELEGELGVTVLGEDGQTLLQEPGPFVFPCQQQELEVCRCPDETPPPQMALIVDEEVYFPPPPPAAVGPNAGPSIRKLAEMSFYIQGPSNGECCEKNAQFLFRGRFSSDFLLPNGANHHIGPVAHWLIRACRGVGGFSIDARTKGIPHAAPETTPGSAFACPAPAGGPALPARNNAIGRIEIESVFDVPITCTEEEGWPCSVGENDHFTRFGMAVPQVGTMGGEVHWRVAATGKSCVLERNATIGKIILFAGALVYSPDQHAEGWLDRKGDADRDGKNNYRELYDGTDPTG